MSRGGQAATVLSVYNIGYTIWATVLQSDFPNVIAMPKKAVRGVAKTGPPLGQVLREARVRRGLSLRDVEHLTGIAVSQLSRTELGARENPAFATVARIASALGLSLDIVSAQAGIGKGGTADNGHVPDIAKVVRALEAARRNAEATLEAIVESGLQKASLTRKRR